MKRDNNVLGFDLILKVLLEAFPEATGIDFAFGLGVDLGFNGNVLLLSIFLLIFTKDKNNVRKKRN